MNRIPGGVQTMSQPQPALTEKQELEEIRQEIRKMRDEVVELYRAQIRIAHIYAGKPIPDELR